MKILVLTNCFPPHVTGPEEATAQGVVEALKLRGHEVQVLTSTHGLNTPQVDREVQRRLWLNGIWGHERLTRYQKLHALELWNNASTKEMVVSARPDLVLVWTLHGLSKSIIYTLNQTPYPVVYAVSDHWLSEGLAEDPWLGWWNQPTPPFMVGLFRTFLELSGARNRLDALAPTRMRRGQNRLLLYDRRYRTRVVEPNSIAAFVFDHLYFSSEFLKHEAVSAGFRVAEGAVIYPGIATHVFFGDIKPAGGSISRFLVASPLHEASGVMTVLQALKLAAENKIRFALTVCGRGDSNYIAELRSFAVTNKLAVEFVTTPRREMPVLYRSHDALVHCAEWKEPFPATALEAMACGLPVISACAGGAAELFHHGDNALTYPMGDFHQLAARMQELQIQPALRCQMAEKAQMEVQTRHNEIIVTDQIEQFLIASQEAMTRPRD